MNDQGVDLADAALDMLPADLGMPADMVMSSDLDMSPDGMLPTTGLDVYASPDTTRVGSTAYIYSDAVLAGTPAVQITSPTGQVSTATATFIANGTPTYGQGTGTGQWWKAPLPGGAVGVWQVTAIATTQAGAAVGGSSSYEVVDAGTGTGWHAVGPNSLGGLLTIDPNDANNMYAAPLGVSQVYASHDHGTTWRMERTLPVAGGLSTALVALGGAGSRLVVSVTGHDILGGLVDPTYEGKAFESTDGAVTWRDLGLADGYIYTLVASADGSMLIAVTSQGVEITHDDGAHWKQVDLTAIPMASANWFDQAALIGSDFYLATFSGLFVIHNIDGASPSAPTLVFDPSVATGTTATGVNHVAGDAQYVYASLLIGGDIYASADQGKTWSKVYHPSSPVQFGFVDAGGTLYADTGAGISVSSDGGTTWALWPNPPGGTTASTGIVLSGKTLYFCSGGVGIYSTADSGQTYSRIGLAGTDVAGLAVAPDSTGASVLVAATNWDTYRAPLSTLVGTPQLEWGASDAEGLINGRAYLIATTPDRTAIYKLRAGFSNKFNLYQSTDAGLTWQTLPPPTFGGFSGGPSALYVDASVPSQLYVAIKSSVSTTLYKSADAGQTWTKITLPAPITSIVGDPKDANHLWLGGPSGLWTSSDGAATLTQLQTTPVSALAVLPNGHLVVGGSQLYLSTNGGVDLTAAQQPNLALYVRALLVSPTAPATIYAATGLYGIAGLLQGGHGVLRSTDGGASWQLHSDGLDDRDTTSLAASPDGLHIYAGTLKGGVYALDAASP